MTSQCDIWWQYLSEIEITFLIVLRAFVKIVTIWLAIVLDFRYQINKAKEDEIRAYNLKMKPVWDAEKAVEAAKANREQLIYLAKETGTKVSAIQE